MFMEKLGAKIKRRRKELDLTQQELGKRVGVSHVTISQWESDTNQPKTENFLNLSHALKYSIEELLTDIDIQIMDEDTFFGIVKSTCPRLTPAKRKELMNFLFDLEIHKNP